jgi:hypothetical protein
MGLLIPEETLPRRPVATAASDAVGVFASHREIFPDLDDSFTEFKRILRSLSRTDTILWCARLNILVSDSTKADPADVQGHCIARFFTRPEIDRINKFAAEHGGRQHASVFFRGQLLELIRWASLMCPDLPNDGTTFEDPGVRQSFARAALLASDIWGRRVPSSPLCQHE